MSEGIEGPASTPGPQRRLRRWDTIAIIVGIVVGAGIFKTPSMVAGITGDAGWMIVAWLLGAGISLAGALCYAELATAFPHAGGDYHFLTRAYGRNLSFLYAWARTMVINAGSIALLAFVFGDYLSVAIPLGDHSSAVWAAVIVIALSLLNIAGLRATSRTQNVLTTIEVAGLVAIVVAGLLAPAAAGSAGAPFTRTPAPGMFGLAMIFVLLTYGGWNEAAYVSAELKGGRRAMVGALVLSIAIIAALYLAVNLALLHGLGLKDLSDSKAAGADVMVRAFGPLGGQLLGLGVAIATLTSINATMIVGARTNYAVATDWPALGLLSGWNESRDAPVAAYIFQALITLMLVGFGALQKDGFTAMVEFTAPVFWAFLMLVGLALFILRAKSGEIDRPFRVPLYPLTPMLFCLVCAYLFYSSVTYAASKDSIHISLSVIAIGFVALALMRLFNRRWTRDEQALNKRP
jgi:APA family basic amino acid/polyamine antiporter